MPKYVVSSTLEDPEWNNSTVLKGDVPEQVAQLREKLAGDIVVHGSAQLVQTLVEHDLVDEFRLMVFPVVLGSGKRLFGETSDKKPLRLVDSKVVGDGVTILTYEPARAFFFFFSSTTSPARGPTCTGIPIPKRGSSAAERRGSPRTEKMSRPVPATSSSLPRRLPTSSRTSAVSGWRSSASTRHRGSSRRSWKSDARTVLTPPASALRTSGLSGAGRPSASTWTAVWRPRMQTSPSRRISQP